MAEALCSSPSKYALLTKTVADIRECVVEMKSFCEENDGCALMDDNSGLQRFCIKMELLLQTGLKNRSGLMTGSKCYWNYICDCLSRNKYLKDGLHFVKSLSELKSNLGRGREFIRFSLVHHRLADTIQQCLMSEKCNREWYHMDSFVHHKRLSEELVTTLYDLNDLHFDLAPRGHDLDAMWPTFSSKSSYIGGVNVWRIPSRSDSIASLSSISSLEVFHSLPPKSMEADSTRFNLNMSDTMTSTPNLLDDLNMDRQEEISEVVPLHHENMDPLQQENTYHLMRSGEFVEDAKCPLETCYYVVQTVSTQTEASYYNNSETQTDHSYKMQPLAEVFCEYDERSGSTEVIRPVEILEQQLVKIAKPESEATNFSEERADFILKIHELESSLQCANLEINSLRLKVGEASFFETAYGELELDKTDLERKILILTEELRHCADKLHHLSQKYDEEHEDLLKLSGVNAQLEFEKSSLQVELVELTELKQMFEQLREQQNVAVETVQQSASEIQQLKASLSCSEHNRGILLSELEIQKEECERLLKVNEQNEVEINLLKETVSKLQEEVASCKSMIELKDTQLVDLNEILSKCQLSLGDSEKKCHEIVVTKDQLITELRDDLEAMTGSVQRREHMWESARKSMEQELQKLHLDIAQQSTQYIDKIKSLELHMSTITADSLITQQQQQEELDDLKQCLGTSENEVCLLRTQIRQKDELLKEHYEARSEADAQCQLMKSDVDHLKKRIVQLLREKNSLWQKSDRLIYEHKLRKSNCWLPSAEIANCMGCHSEFTVTIRKHHCRECGRVFCWKCCSNWYQTAHCSHKERLCNECAAKMAESSDESGSESDSETNILDVSSSNTSDETENSDRLPSVRLQTTSDETENSDGLQSVRLQTTSDETENSDRLQSVRLQTTSGEKENSDKLQSVRLQTTSDEKENSDNLQSVRLQTTNDETENSDGLQSIRLQTTSDETENSDRLQSVRLQTTSDETENSDRLQSARLQTTSDETENSDRLQSVRMHDTRHSISLHLVNDSALPVIVNDHGTPVINDNILPLIAGETCITVISDVLPMIDPENTKSVMTTQPGSVVRNSSCSEIDRDAPANNDDIFDIITIEEISESSSYPLPDPQVVCCQRIIASDMNDASITAPAELSVKAGKMYAVPVLMDIPDCTLSWCFTTKPKGIEFTVTFKPSDVLAHQQCQTLIPKCKVDSHCTPCQGHLKAQHLGVYTLVFDNTASRFTAKKLEYSLNLSVNRD